MPDLYALIGFSIPEPFLVFECGLDAVELIEPALPSSKPSLPCTLGNPEPYMEMISDVVSR